MQNKNNMLIFITLVLCISLVGLSSISASDISTNQSADLDNLIITDSNMDNSNVDEVNILDDSSEVDSVDTVDNTVNITSKSLKTEDGDSIILTDDNYDQYFTDNVYNSEITNITLGSDIKNKDFIFNTFVNVSNDDNYTIYNSTITVNYNATFNGLKVNTTGKETVFFSNADNIYLNNLVIYHENNGLARTIIIGEDGHSYIKDSNIITKGAEISSDSLPSNIAILNYGVFDIENDTINISYLTSDKEGTTCAIFKNGTKSELRIIRALNIIVDADNNGIGLFSTDSFVLFSINITVDATNAIGINSSGLSVYTGNFSIIGSNSAKAIITNKGSFFNNIKVTCISNGTSIAIENNNVNKSSLVIYGISLNIEGNDIIVFNGSNASSFNVTGISGNIVGNNVSFLNLNNFDMSYLYSGNINVNGSNVSLLTYNNGNKSSINKVNFNISGNDNVSVYDLNNVTTFINNATSSNITGNIISVLKIDNGNVYVYFSNFTISGELISVNELDNVTTFVMGGGTCNITGNNVSFLKQENGNYTEVHTNVNINSTGVVSVVDLDNVTNFYTSTSFNVNGTNVSFLKHENGNCSGLGSCSLRINATGVISAIELNNVNYSYTGGNFFSLNGTNVSFIKYTNGINFSNIGYTLNVVADNVSVIDLYNVTSLTGGGSPYNINATNVSFIKHTNGNLTYMGGYTLNIRADVVSIVDLDNINNSVLDYNRFNITADTISLINGNSNFTDISYNNINLTGENLSGVNLSDINNSVIYNNTFKVNTTDTTKPVIVLNNVSNTEVFNNTFKGTTELPFVFNDSENITYNPNYFNIVLTDDNYYKFFDEDGVLKYYYVNISLGSDIYNKDFIFNYPVNFTNYKVITYYGNGYEYYNLYNNYTIYNSTITINENSISRLQYIRLVNTDDRSTSLIIRNNSYYIYGLNLTQVNTDNDTKAIIFENILKTYNTTSRIYNSTSHTYYYVNVTRLNSMDLQGNINITSNSGSIFVLDNATARFNLYPTVVARGNNLSYVNIVNTNWSEVRGGTLYLKNNISVSVINIENSSNISYNSNNLYLLNNSYVNNSVVSLLNSSSINVTYNYIYTKDVYGNNAVNITGNNIIVINNYPTSYQNVSYPITVTLDHEGERIMYYPNNTVRFNVTDIFGDPVEEGIVYIDVNWVNQNTGGGYLTSQTASIINGTATFNIYIGDPGTSYGNLIKITGYARVGNIYSYFDDYSTNKGYYFMYMRYLTSVEVQPINGYITDNITIIAMVKINGTNEYINWGNVSIMINGRMLRDDDGNIIQVPIENYVVKYTYNTTFKNVNVIVQYNGLLGVFNRSTSPTVRTNLSLIQTITEVDPITAEIGDNVTINVTVKDEFNNSVNDGYVMIFVNSIALRDSNGTMIRFNVTNGSVSADYLVQKVNVRVHSVYYGTNIYNKSTSEVLVAKIKLNTTTSLNSLISKVNENVTITAIVRDINGNKVTGGKVAFKVNGKTIGYGVVKNGVATINYTSGSVKVNNISAIYSGSSSYIGSRSNNATLTFNKRVADISLSMLKSSISMGEVDTFTVRVSDGGKSVSSGKVVFKLNGKTLTDADGNVIYVNVVNGVASLNYSIPELTAGDYNLSVVYSNGVYERAETSSTLTINKIATHVELDNITTTKNNTQTVITAKIYNNNTNTLISGSNKVTIKLNGVTVKQTTAVNGVVNTTIDTSQYKNSQYTIMIISGDTKTYLSSTTTATLTIKQ